MLDTDNFKKNIHDDYEIEDELGSGQFAVVRRIVEKETGDEFAAKYVRKKRTKASRNGMSREDIKREIEILRMVDSEKIIKVHDVYETDKEMILVMELLRGGELFDYISKKDYLTEEEAIDFTRQILQGLQHLHSRSVVHLDLKPENILLKNTRRKTIKLVDFGLARVVKQNEQVREIMGTPEFVAPEVLNFDTISTATDMWALGVIAYILLSGASPFLGEDNQETFTNIIQVDYQFDEEYFAEISDEAKDFIRKLLVKDPRKRPTAHDSSRHPWVEEEVVDKKKRQRRRTTQICTFNFKRFVARKRWKMSYNKIRAMNLIAKMGIKPPPGFIAEIPPMVENNENVLPEPEEKTTSHKEHKKNQSTINRRKHKQSSSPKPTVEKTGSLTLKTMDIDIGEGQGAEPQPELVNENETDKQVEPSPAVEEPVDYGSMSKREKRRARGQLRMDEIAKSKQEIDAKHAKLESDEVGGESGEYAPATNVEVSTRDDEKPAEDVIVTSTMHIEHKPATKTQSGGILKKRDYKGGRIPSTEDHYFVALNAALFQDDAFYPSGLQPTRQHGILKHTTSAPNTSEDTTIVSELKTQVSEVATQVSEVTTQVAEVPTQVSADTPPESVSSSSEDLPKSDETVPKTSENKKISEFATVVEVVSGGIIPPGVDDPGGTSGMVISLQAEKTVAHTPEREIIKENEAATPKADLKPTSSSRRDSDTKSTKDAAPTPKKPLAKTDNPSQQRGFTPPPWQRKASTDNLKPNSKSLHGVSKVSLKANRFVSNDKQSSPKSPTTSAAPASTKTSNVLGRSKLFQKETSTNKLDVKKTAATKSSSTGQELKNVACDINLDDSPSKNGVKISVSKPSADTESKPLETQSDSQLKPRSDSQTKSRSDSQTKTRSGSIKGNNVNKNSNTNNKQENVNNAGGKITVNGSRSHSNCSQNKFSYDEGKVLNGVDKQVKESSSTIEISGGNEEAVLETESEVKEELKSTSTHSLTEFTIRPRQNSGEHKAGGFDIMLTIAPPSDEPAQEPRAVSTMKTRFTSSVSSLPDPRSGVPNGKLTSLSTSDMTSRSREAVTSPTAERHGAAQGSRYTPQRDFSKYLSSDQPRSTKTIAVPANTQKSPTINWQVKRNTPQVPTTVPPKTTITPTSPTTRAPSATAKTAAAKVSATVAMPKGKKSASTSTAYIPRRSFGFTSKPTNQSETVVKPSEPDDATKFNNNDESKRWSQSSYTSDRSASSASSDELSLSNVTAENNALNCSNTGSSEQISVENPEISRKIENHSEHGKLNPRASPVLERKWKATLVLPKESEKVPTTRNRDIRISSTNAPRKNKFSNVRSMWEGK